jgi:hypothetical protein
LLIWLLAYSLQLITGTPAAHAALQPRPWMAFTTAALALLATLLNP